MKELKATANEYWPHLLRHWWGVAFGLVFAVLGAVDLMLEGFHIVWWIWWLLAFVALGTAQFLCYHRIRMERDRLRRYGIAQSKLTHLTDFRDEFVSLQNDTPADKIVLGRWMERYDNKRSEIIAYLAQQISPAEAALYKRIGDFDLIATAGKAYLDVEHLKITAQIIRDHRWLQKMVQDYGRTRFRPELDVSPDSTACDTA